MEAPRLGKGGGRTVFKGDAPSRRRLRKGVGLGRPPQRVRSWSHRTAQQWAFLLVPPDTSGSPFQIFTWPHFLPISPADPGIEKEQDLALSLVTDLLPVPRPQLHAASSPPSLSSFARKTKPALS